jgi:hypothetical protein
MYQRAAVERKIRGGSLRQEARSALKKHLPCLYDTGIVVVDTGQNFRSEDWRGRP